MAAQQANQNIVLIGFMGSGKTTIGTKLAERLHREFIDVDQWIENRERMTVKQIFAKYGEKAFRDKEKAAIQACVAGHNKIIAPGGGAFLQEEIRRYCLENAAVVFLDISWDHWVERMDLLIEDRPVLQGKSLEDIRKIYEERQEIYAHHHYMVPVDGCTPDEVSDHIISILHL